MFTEHMTAHPQKQLTVANRMVPAGTSSGSRRHQAQRSPNRGETHGRKEESLKGENMADKKKPGCC